MSERTMKNFPIEFEGNTYWRSRSVACAGFIYCKDEEGNWHILCEQRGQGAANYRGLWCCVCGFLDFNENGQECISRETHEETGVMIEPNEFKFHDVFFDTKDEQNVTLEYVYVEHTKVITDFQLSDKYNEKDETSDIQWLPLKNIQDKEWAFGHEKIIPELAKKYITC